MNTGYTDKLEKVEVLINQNRLDQAGLILQDLLSENPNDDIALYLLSILYSKRGQVKEAEEAIDRSLALSPDDTDYLLWKASILLDQKDYKQFEEILDNVIRLEPVNDEAFALLAYEKMLIKKFEQALEYATKALEINPENLFALNTKSSALHKLKKTDESRQDIEAALQLNPNDPYTHTNYAYDLLERGKMDEALKHFKLALEIDPEYEYAQQGILEVLRARNPLYRLFLKYAFWISNFSEKYQWFIIIGFYLLYRFMIKMSVKHPEYNLILKPLLITMGLMMFSTWIITPLSNLFLRFNIYGKLLLSKDEIVSSNFVAGSLLTGIAGLLLYLTFHDEYYISLAFLGFTMMIPFGVMFKSEKNRKILVAYTVGLLFFGILAVVTHIQTGVMFNSYAVKYLLGLFIFQWVANYLIMKG